MTIFRIFLVAFLGLIATGGAVWNRAHQKEILRLRAMLPDPGKRLLDRRRLNYALERIQAMQAKISASERQFEREASHPADGAPSAHSAPALPPNKDAFQSPEMKMEVRKLRTLLTRTTLDSGYGTLFQKLTTEAKITPAQLSALKDLLVKRVQVVEDSAESSSGPGPDFIQAAAAVTGNVDEQIKNVLGAQAYFQFRQHLESLPERNAVQLVAQSLDYNVPPLNPAQVEQLVGALARKPAILPGVGNVTALLTAPDALATVSNDAIAAAADILSPEQLDSLQQVQLQQEAQRMLFRWIQELQYPSKP